MKPLISIIIPVYNRQQELWLSLDSIQKQTYRPLEVILIDDGSEEKVFLSEEVKRKMGDISFQVVRQENKGAPAARNKGFSLSKGEFVIFWDADTLGNLDMLEKMFVTLSEHPEASFVYSNHTHAGKIKFRSRAFDVGELKKNNYINTMSLLHHQDFPGFDESLKRFQDWDLWLTLAEQGKKGIWIDEFLYNSVPTKVGISYWLPSFAYRAPWKYFPFVYKKIKAYENAKKIIYQKYNLM